MGFFDNIFGGKKSADDLKSTEALHQKQPNDTALLKKLIDLYTKANDEKSAAEACLKLGVIYYDKGFHPKAASLFKQAQKLLPAWEKPLEKLADIYKMQGFARDAAAMYYKLAELNEKKGNKDLALDFLQKATELAPSQQNIHKTTESFETKEKEMHEEVPLNSPAATVHKQKDFFDLNEELGREVDDLKIYDALVEQENGTGVDSIFREIEKSAKEEGREDPLFVYNMGLAYRETGLLDDAIDSFKKVIASGQRLFDSYMMLGKTYRDNSHLEESLATLKTALALEGISDKMKAGLLYEISLTYKEMGEKAKALEILKEISNEFSDFRDVKEEMSKLSSGE